MREFADTPLCNGAGRQYWGAVFEIVRCSVVMKGCFCHGRGLFMYWWDERDPICLMAGCCLCSDTTALAMEEIAERRQDLRSAGKIWETPAAKWLCFPSHSFHWGMERDSLTFCSSCIFYILCCFVLCLTNCWHLESQQSLALKRYFHYNLDPPLCFFICTITQHPNSASLCATA